MLAIDVTRAQLSDMLRLRHPSRLKEFHFTLEEEADGSWPLHSRGHGCPADVIDVRGTALLPGWAVLVPLTAFIPKFVVPHRQRTFD